MIEWRQVSVAYGKETVLHSVSLQMEKGSLLSVIGVNGSGKSTLLKATAGLLPASGEIRVDGLEIAGLSRQETAKRIAYLAQDRSIPDMTVEQMVLHGRFPHLHYPRCYSKQDHAIADNVMTLLGVEQLRHKPLATLSGGMRQKVYLAMALAQDADYILLDEPTTYLDPAGQLELMECLRALASNGKGVITVMHDLPLAFSRSDRIAVLQNGELCVCDAPASICHSCIVEQVFGVSLCRGENGTYYYHYGK